MWDFPSLVIYKSCGCGLSRAYASAFKFFKLGQARRGMALITDQRILTPIDTSLSAITQKGDWALLATPSLTVLCRSTVAASVQRFALLIVVLRSSWSSGARNCCRCAL